MVANGLVRGVWAWHGRRGQVWEDRGPLGGQVAEGEDALSVSKGGEGGGGGPHRAGEDKGGDASLLAVSREASRGEGGRGGMFTHFR